MKKLCVLSTIFILIFMTGCQKNDKIINTNNLPEFVKVNNNDLQIALNNTIPSLKINATITQKIKTGIGTTITQSKRTPKSSSAEYRGPLIKTSITYYDDLDTAEPKIINLDGNTNNSWYAKTLSQAGIQGYNQSFELLDYIDATKCVMKTNNVFSCDTSPNETIIKINNYFVIEIEGGPYHGVTTFENFYNTSVKLPKYTLISKYDDTFRSKIFF